MRVASVLALVLVLALVGALLHNMGVVQFNRPSPDRFPLVGIDVSHHQGEIDWPAVAAAGTAFAYLKATEGRDFSDSRFATNWLQAGAAGIPRGAYHFFTFCSPGAAQAEHFLRVAPPSPGALAPVADVEFVGNCTNFGDLNQVRRELEVFLAIVEEAWGTEPVIYVTPDALERVVGSAIPDSPVWIRSVFTEPPLDAYRMWVLWQFSDNSRVRGITGPVDRNALRPGLTLGAITSPAA